MAATAARRSMTRRVWDWLDRPIDPDNPGIRFVRAFEGTAQRGPYGPSPVVVESLDGPCPVCAAAMSTHPLVRTRGKASMICPGA